LPFGYTTCEKCRRKISGKMIYAGGSVWHPDCFPYKKAAPKKPAAKTPAKARPTRKKSARP
jgi:hypothetical protein